MRNRQISLSRLGLGLLCGLAWYIVFGLGILFHLDYPTHIYWGRVTIAAVISFLVGWGVVHLISLLRSNRI
jgi:hypothetical protein